MKVNGIQYYWFIFVGLALGICMPILLAIYDIDLDLDSTPLRSGGFLLFMLYPGICYLTVLAEIWSRIGVRFVGVVLGILMLSILVHPYFILIYLIGPTAYWISRINGLPADAIDG